MRRVWVDVKESADVITRLRMNLEPEFEVAVTNLGESSGDLMVELKQEVLVVERKTPEDLLGSLAGDRLFQQCEGIARLSRFAWLVVDGEFRYDLNQHVLGWRGGKRVATDWTRDHVNGALRRCQALGVFTEEAYDSYPRTVRRLVEWCDKCDRAHVKKRNIVHNPFNERAQEVADFVGFFPGLDAARIQAYLEWSGERRKAEHLCLMTKPMKVEDKPRLWGPGIQQALRDYLELRKNEQMVIISSPIEYEEQIGGHDEHQENQESHRSEGGESGDGGPD